MRCGEGRGEGGGAGGGGGVWDNIFPWLICKEDFFFILKPCFIYSMIFYKSHTTKKYIFSMNFIYKIS